MTHAEAQKVHTKRRVRRHYNIGISSSEYMAMVCQIQSRRSLYLRKLSKSRTLHLVEHRDIIVPAVYDKVNHTIATVLHNNHLEKIGAI